VRGPATMVFGEGPWRKPIGTYMHAQMDSGNQPRLRRNRNHPTPPCTRRSFQLRGFPGAHGGGGSAEKTESRAWSRVCPVGSTCQRLVAEGRTGLARGRACPVHFSQTKRVS
jgi:hypothetical protein